MNIIDNINTKIAELVALGLTDEARVRRALTTALAQYPNRDPNIILQQQYALMLIQFHGGDTKYVKGGK
jgi:hypothetical protein